MSIWDLKVGQDLKSDNRPADPVTPTQRARAMMRETLRRLEERETPTQRMRDQLRQLEGHTPGQRARVVLRDTIARIEERERGPLQPIPETLPSCVQAYGCFAKAITICQGWK